MVIKVQPIRFLLQTSILSRTKRSVFYLMKQQESNYEFRASRNFQLLNSFIFVQNLLFCSVEIVYDMFSIDFLLPPNMLQGAILGIRNRY